MDEKATETTEETIAAPAAEVLSEDLEARYKKLEDEKNNYKQAYLKEVKKNKEESEPLDDERIRKIVDEGIASSRVAEIAREQDGLIQKILKENRELKLAHQNKPMPPTAAGTHVEGPQVKDTLVTDDQMAFFKSQGWDDNKIAAYKKNLLRTSGR